MASREFCIPEHAEVVEEQELKGNRLRFLRLSGRGPYTGWASWFKLRVSVFMLVKFEPPPR